MTTRTARLYDTDIQRAQVLAAVRGETPQDLLHAALEEFIANHRDELDTSFRRVQDAVLSDDRAALRGVFLRRAERHVADANRIDRLIESSR